MRLRVSLILALIVITHCAIGYAQEARNDAALTANADLQLALDSEIGKRVCHAERDWYKERLALALADRQSGTEIERAYRRRVIVGVVVGFIGGVTLSVGALAVGAYVVRTR